MTPGTARPLLVTDSCCDLPRELLASLDVTVLDYPVILDGAELAGVDGGPPTHERFYGLVRAGGSPSTAAIPVPVYAEVFMAAAAEGRPVVLVGLSHALSGTFDRAADARDLALEAYPDADIRLVESRNASIALGALVLEAARLVHEGVDVDALEAWLHDHRLRVNGHFTLDTLEYLRRGGRISDVAAAAGTMLDIKPVLTFDLEGGLVIAEKVRGRRKSMRALVEAAVRTAEDPGSRTVIVAHGDAEADAEALRDMLAERVPFAETVMTQVGPVIGSHVGPGMLAVAFIGAQRS